MKAAGTRHARRDVAVELPVERRAGATWGVRAEAYDDGALVEEPWAFYRTCAVDADGTVRAWDPIAQHFTRAHGLSPKQVAEVRRLAGHSA